MEQRVWSGMPAMAGWAAPVASWLAGWLLWPAGWLGRSHDQLAAVHGSGLAGYLCVALVVAGWLAGWLSCWLAGWHTCCGYCMGAASPDISA
eukprot:365837-Chlamydomonas_euryale.AAC.3